MIFFVIGKVLGSNRVSADVEIAGLDIPEMGMAGYPEFIKVVSPEEVEVPPGLAAGAAAAE